jgi:hypothetical protein
MFFKQLKAKPKISIADLTEAALLYVDIYHEPGRTPHRKVLVHEPVIPTYHHLRFTDLADMAVLPPILDMMEFVVDELRAARMASAGHSMPAALPAEPIADTIVDRVEGGAVVKANGAAPHTFQSFWHGDALSPYELFCLKSFIDCGYAVDLYTYDMDLVVPTGVRVCDAAGAHQSKGGLRLSGGRLRQGIAIGILKPFQIQASRRKGGLVDRHRRRVS